MLSIKALLLIPTLEKRVSLRLGGLRLPSPDRLAGTRIQCDVDAGGQRGPRLARAELGVPGRHQGADGKSSAARPTLGTRGAGLGQECESIGLDEDA